MSDPKPFASLSSGLLARKGGAKPAMRPQGFGQGFGLDDLGWNDMGSAQQPEAEIHSLHPREEAPEHVPSSIAALTPAPKNEDAPNTDLTSDRIVAPPVVEQQRAIEASFAERAPVAPAQKAPADVVALAPRPRQERGIKDKAAFTLRLDTQRHLKLRLACAVTHRSAQHIVSKALDDYLASLPELESLANQVPAKLGKRS